MKYLLIFLFISGAHASLYEQSKRRMYLKEVLTAFIKSKNKELKDTNSYISLMRSNGCQSDMESLAVDCLVSAAKTNCKQKRGKQTRLRCQQYSDVIVTNALSEGKFVSKSEKYRMMKHEKDYRSALEKKKTQKYAAIATQFYLSVGGECKKGKKNYYECLSEKIDNFCLDYGDEKSMSWHHCSSALVWFIGTAI